jgi:hypothetical protein
MFKWINVFETLKWYLVHCKHSISVGYYYLTCEFLNHSAQRLVSSTPWIIPWIAIIDLHLTFGLRLKLSNRKSTVGLIIKFNWRAENRNRKNSKNGHVSLYLLFQYLCYTAPAGESLLK